MADGSITLADVSAKTPTLKVACTRCDRAGKYRLDKLIAQHGSRFGIPRLLDVLAADCPKHGTGSYYDVCGIHCPDLSALFLGRSG